MKDLFQMPAIVDEFKVLKDRSAKFSVNTRELEADEMGTLASLMHKEGWFVFAPNAMQPSDIPEEPAEDVGTKSPQKRLRDVLFVYWSKTTNKKTPFDIWYRAWIDKKCEEIKDLIPAEERE